MNKYKEALKAFDIEEKSSNCDKCPATIYNHCQYGENGMPFENNCLAYKLIQELVDKETPMKVLSNSKGFKKQYRYLCPNCKKYLFSANSQTMRFIGHEENYSHCAYCGQKLDWSE